MTDNNFTNNNVFFFVSDLKIVYYNNYQSLIIMPWIREEKYLVSLLIWRQKSFKIVSKKMQPINILMIYY